MQALIEACLEEDGKLYLCVSSPTIKDKPVCLTTRLTQGPVSPLANQVNLIKQNKSLQSLTDS